MTSLKPQKRPSTVGRLRKWSPHRKNWLNDLNEPVKQVSLSTAREKATDSIGHELQCPPQHYSKTRECFTP